MPIPKCCGAALVHGFGYDTFNYREDAKTVDEGLNPALGEAVRDGIKEITEDFNKLRGVFTPYAMFERPKEAEYDPSAYWSGRRSHLIAYLSEHQLRRHREFLEDLGWRVVDSFRNAKSMRKVFLLTLKEGQDD